MKRLCSIYDVALLNLPKSEDPCGNLTFVEQETHVPFKISRVYWIYDVPGGEQRGGHAYRRQEDGHRSTSFAHLANISLAVNKRIEWDAEAEKVTNSKRANRLLHYDYRKPWHL